MEFEKKLGQRQIVERRRLFTFLTLQNPLASR